MRSWSTAFVAALALAGPSSLPTAAATEAAPESAVRDYFDALEHQDLGRALALTEGAAQARTSALLDRLRHEAAAHHARVELKVRALDVAPEPGPASPGLGLPVAAQFHIDVIGHKWLFHRVARRIEGWARFFVDPERQSHIVAIDGQLE